MKDRTTLAKPADVIAACRALRPTMARALARLDPIDPIAIEEGRLKMRMLDAIERRCNGATGRVALSPDEQRLLSGPEASNLRELGSAGGRL